MPPPTVAIYRRRLTAPLYLAWWFSSCRRLNLTTGAWFLLRPGRGLRRGLTARCRSRRAEDLADALPRRHDLGILRKPDAVERVEHPHDLDDLVRNGVQLRPRPNVSGASFGSVLHRLVELSQRLAQGSEQRAGQ